MPKTAWSAHVTNVQGREIPATDIPWIRAREMWIHSVDLDVGASFADFPAPMLAELLTDVAAAMGDEAGLPAVAARRTRRDGVDGRRPGRAHHGVRACARAGGVAARPEQGSGDGPQRRAAAGPLPRCAARRLAVAASDLRAAARALRADRATRLAGACSRELRVRRRGRLAVRRAPARLRRRPRRVRAARRRSRRRCSPRPSGRPAARPGPGPDRVDATDVELVTIDPPGAKDLDQALGVTRRGGGFRVHYAIADLGAVVVPGGAARRGGAPPRADRLPARRVGAAAPAGALRGRVEPAPRRAARGGALDDRPGRGGRADGRGRAAGRRAVAGRGWTTRACRPTSTRAGCTRRWPRCPSWGRCAGRRPCGAGRSSWSCPSRRSCRTARAAGPCRCGGGSTSRRGTRRSRCSPAWPRPGSCWTPASGCCARCPRRSPRRWRRSGRTARELGFAWPDGATAAELLAGLTAADPGGARRCAGRPPRCCAEPATPRSTAAAGLPAPADPGHGGIGAPYAHVTAPLRRLVDRFGTELCLAVAAGARAAGLAARGAARRCRRLMSASDTLAGKVDRACVDRTEAALLAGAGRRGVRRRGAAAERAATASRARSTCRTRRCWPAAPGR